MKNYNCEVIANYRSTEDGKSKKVGEIVKCTKERYEVLKNANVVKLISIDAEREKVVKVEDNFIDTKPNKKKNKKNKR